MSTTGTADELEHMRKHWQFSAIRELPDGSIAGVQRLLTTWSLVLGVDEHQWRYRFCFKLLSGAVRALESVEGERDIPEGWIACRPQVHVLDERGRPRYPTAAELRELRSRNAR